MAGLVLGVVCQGRAQRLGPTLPAGQEEDTCVLWVDSWLAGWVQQKLYDMAPVCACSTQGAWNGGGVTGLVW